MGGNIEAIIGVLAAIVWVQAISGAVQKFRKNVNLQRLWDAAVTVDVRKVEPVPTSYQYIIMRYDIYHIEGEKVGCYVDEDVAKKHLESLRAQAQREGPDFFFNAARANFILYKRVPDEPSAA